MIYIKSISINNDVPEGYETKIPAIAEIISKGVLNFNNAVTFITGENGSGKSTLIEAIAVAAGFNAEGGSRNMRFETYSSHSPLYKYIDINKNYILPRDGYFLRAESFYNIASYIEELDSQPAASRPIKDSYGGKTLFAYSHGESFMALVNNRLLGEGLYIFDEPEAALSPYRQLGLISNIHELVQKDSQFIIATHSPFLMAYPGASIYVLSEDGIKLTDYNETEHYKITRDFINDYKRMISYIISNQL